LWPKIANRARHESLRDVAGDYGVSHERIPAAVRREHLQGAARAVP
jgi:hypothetical protein